MPIQLFSTLHISRFFMMACGFVLVLCLGPQVQAQKMSCGADALLKAKLEEENISMDEYRERMRTQIQAKRPIIAGKKAQETIYTIPVVVHLGFLADATIESFNGYLTDCHVITAIEELNKIYSQTHGFDIPSEYASVAAGDIRIRFELATRDPEGNPTTGIRRRILDDDFWRELGEFPGRFEAAFNTAMGPWDTGKYLNVYIHPRGNSATFGSATLPEAGFHEDNGGWDFVVVASVAFSPIPPHAPDKNMARILAHEVGHYLNLHHTFTDCPSSDECEDTPSALEGANWTCVPTASCKGPPSMIQNYMEYSPDACMRLFTTCQKQRMRNALTTFRYNLYADDNRALDGDHPPIDMAIHTDIERSRPHALYDTETRRFRLDTLFLANQGRTSVNRAVVKFAIDGNEVASFTLNRRFDLCDIQEIAVPAEVRNTLATVPLDESVEHTLVVSVDAEGEGYRTNDTLRISRRVGPPLTLTAHTLEVAEIPSANALPATAETLNANIRIGGGATGWTASTTSDFLTALTPSGTGSGILRIRHSANTTASPRTGKVLVQTTGLGTEISHTLTLTQRVSSPLGTSSGDAGGLSSPVLVDLFPNPSHGEVFLDIDTKKRQEIQVSFFDASGNLGYRQVIEVTPSDNLVGLTPKMVGGTLYFVHIKGENLDEIRRLVVR